MAFYALDKVATGSYFETMETIITVGIKDLKNNLSSYIREVKQGTRILVTERNQVVAELREPLAQESEGPGHPLLRQWVKEGALRLPLNTSSGSLPSPVISLPDGTALQSLREDRGE